MWLYENPTQGLYIHSQECMMHIFTYQDLMDIAVANYGRPMTKEKLRKALREQINMVLEDLKESYDLCEDAMIRETNKECKEEE